MMDVKRICNPQETISWLEKVAIQGCDKFWPYLAGTYFEEYEDYDKAHPWLDKAVEQKVSTKLIPTLSSTLDTELIPIPTS